MYITPNTQQNNKRPPYDGDEDERGETKADGNRGQQNSNDQEKNNNEDPDDEMDDEKEDETS